MSMPIQTKMKVKMSNKVIVVGGGASGLMAAGTAAEYGCEVTLIEKNSKLGRKLLITGKGRCNITNFCDNETFISNLTKNPRFMYSAINNFSCYDTISFFEDLGLHTKTERGNRVFPESDKAFDVLNALIKYNKDNGVNVLAYSSVKHLIFDDNKVIGVELENQEKIFADKVIVTCGGLSYKQTGSTGDGYALAKEAGHSISKLIPSLISLVSGDDFCKDLQGLSLRNISISVIDNNSNSEIYNDFGELLFTHYGLSGPVILSASAHMRDMSKDRYKVIIDLKPALDESTLDKRVLKDLNENINKDLINSLNKLLPLSIIPIVIRKSGIDERKKCNSITSNERKQLVNAIKRFEVNISSLYDINDAIITSGGINVNEISPKTMQSKLKDNLYFCGEVLDVDAYTGGFNLQIAFSTGRLAGLSASK